jgi:hypothetical protein
MEDPLKRPSIPCPLVSSLTICLVTACNDGSPTGPKYEPEIPTDFTSDITNPFLPMAPGTIYTYEGDTEDGHETNTVEVLTTTRTIMEVVATVVHDRVYLDGDLTEETYDWFAQDGEGNVWYLGEDSKEIENGRVVSTEGSWEWGVDEALPGVIMWGSPGEHVGEEYRQEYQKGEAEDWGMVVSLTESVSVSYGSFTGCLKTEEWNALEKKSREAKYYCSGVGVVKEVILQGSTAGETSELVSITGG